MSANESIDVLFVEDNVLANRLGMLILEELDCRVDAAPSGRSAIDFAMRVPYKVIFMDIGLPDMCGVDVIKEIRLSQLNNEVPIIALTAHSDKEYMAQCYKAGATLFLVKPLSFDVAGEVLRKYISF